MSRIWHEMDMQLANYVRGKGIEILIVGAVSIVAFSLFGLGYALLLGFLVGLSVVIPYVGAVVVTVPVAVVAWFQWGWTPMFGYLMLAYLVIQILDGNVLVPCCSPRPTTCTRSRSSSRCSCSVRSGACGGRFSPSRSPRSSRPR